MKKILLAGVALGFFIGSPSAFAAVLSFTDSAAFTAAVTGATTYGFDGIASAYDPNTPGSGFAIGSQTVAGVTFSSNNIPFVIGADYNPIYGVAFFSGQGNADNVPANIVSVELSGFNAIGFFYGSYITQNEPYSAKLNTGDVFNMATPSVSAGKLNFIGFVSDAGAITNIDFTSMAGLNPTSNTQGFGYAFDITQFIVADANTSPVPEPATMLLFGTGIAGLAAVGRKKRS